MTNHEPFAFKSSEELLKRAEELGAQLPFQDSIEPLLKSFTIGSKQIPNRMAVQPMEGFDGEPDGSPGELTFRRYRRYAQGGSGLIWFEATSVVREGRSNPHQLWLHAGSLDKFKQLVQHTRDTAHQVFGHSHDVFLVLQLTHSGRYSQPEGKPAPLAAAVFPSCWRCGIGTKKSIIYRAGTKLLCLSRCTQRFAGEWLPGPTKGLYLLFRLYPINEARPSRRMCDS
jgi:hypothetical protein